LSGRWAGQEARANDQGRERADKRAQGALCSGTLVNLTLLRCPAIAASVELAAARPQAAMSVLVKASRTGRSASHPHPAPPGAAQLPGSFACAWGTARATSSRARMSCFAGSVGQPVVQYIGRGVQYGPVGMSDGQTELGVTFPCPTMGAGKPRGGVVAASSAGSLHTNEGHLSGENSL